MWHDELLSIFSKHRAQDVTGVPEYVALCEEHKENDAFNQARSLIKGVKTRLERNVGEQGTGKLQVEHALRTLHGYRQDAPDECRHLIEVVYAPKWSSAQTTYFRETADALLSWRDYFLSFTSRNPNRNAKSAINREHKWFLIHTLGQRRYDTADLAKDNLLAEALKGELANGFLEGFYYPEHESDPEYVSDTLRTECEGSLTFVQLIQSEMFRAPDNGPNWCFVEYETKRAQRDQTLFVLAESWAHLSMILANVNATYQDWRDESLAMPGIEIETTALEVNMDTARSNLIAIRDRVIAAILRARGRLFEGAPA